MLQKLNLNSYHHTDSLLVQFVLNDFLLTLEEACIIRTFTDQKVATDEFVQKLTGYLVNLAGSEQAYMRIFSWIVDSGVLTKLKNTSDLLSERTKKGDGDFALLHSTAHKAWIDCLYTVDLIRDFQGSEVDAVYLRKAVEKCLNSIQKLKPAVKKILPKYIEDENMLFFILRNKERFDTQMGALWSKKLFNTHYPDGALAHMTEKFGARGFMNLLPEITMKLQEMAT